MGEFNNMSKVSIIIRALNEEKYLPECIENINQQEFQGDYEIILVDSGSIDQTVNIAERFGAQIVRIQQDNFTFGRSLNLGCKQAKGDVLVFISAHCIPYGNHWLRELCEPIFLGTAPYAYGRQIIRDEVSNVAEGNVFKQYYPALCSTNRLPYFVNNANAALSRKIWENFQFDENLTGLEDMALGKVLVDHGLCIDYVPNAAVEHIHTETWSQIRNRYEREAVAMQTIDESLALKFWEALYCFTMAIIKDILTHPKGAIRKIFDIIIYRSAQFYGGYYGGKLSRKKVHERKAMYFYPR